MSQHSVGQHGLGQHGPGQLGLGLLASDTVISGVTGIAGATEIPARATRPARTDAGETPASRALLGAVWDALRSRLRRSGGGKGNGGESKSGRRALTGSSGIGLGVAVLWFSLLVLIPLAAVVGTAASGGVGPFVAALTNKQTLNAILLTSGISLLVTALNVVVGTLIAWVLVRDRFCGRSVLDVVIDIPFALPTVVAGLVLLSLYGDGSPLGIDIANTRWAVVFALAFVTLPFVVRAVQPVLEELDTDVEEAAGLLGASQPTIFVKVVLPSLVPAITSGAALSFARGISEYGSLVLLSGNLPNRTEVVSVRVLSHIENGDLVSASALATGMLIIAALAIFGLDVIRRKAARRDS
ncbi:sulfate ABC transporter permease subunit CysT [Propionibacterium freudenreichii]|uniref:sulfate ABC transporter permease subunit CysT n=1 Tax=Propionibacterium freudenreichii TaxID=1744 RepID=UPI00254A30CC|nr:sulfate ABC transporter permease subunit CysT [Propionibacterium freudenreichii]MDK9646611.1 sulfate ABC transporter permease subunit CysT [Propionibacterium freudenreichii]MDK9666462.1 sulfate ABC transporter permease subunit CysT [Propionibacterium freudenreichii]